MFKVGQLVVCIKDNFKGPVPKGLDSSTIPLPIKGCIYTVAGYDVAASGAFIFLYEMCMPGWQVSYTQDHFRPLASNYNTKKDLMKLFLPNGSPVKV